MFNKYLLNEWKNVQQNGITVQGERNAQQNRILVQGERNDAKVVNIWRNESMKTEKYNTISRTISLVQWHMPTIIGTWEADVGE